MAELKKPIELLELEDGKSATFRVVSWEKGTLTIVPAHAPQGKTVDTLRVVVRPEDKPTFPPYWDITSARLVAQLEAQLRRQDLARLTFTITARGIPPKKSFTVDTRPE